jgi:hypothetical protein
VEKEIKPLAIQIDENHKIPDELVQKMSAMGFLGSYLPEAYGGAGLDILSYTIVVEEVSKACASSGVLISAHTSLACDPILQYGTDDQKKKFLPPLAGLSVRSCLQNRKQAATWRDWPPPIRKTAMDLLLMATKSSSQMAAIAVQGSCLPLWIGP